jgi:hypothetical protein
MWTILTSLFSSDWVHDKFDDDRCMFLVRDVIGVSLTAFLARPSHVSRRGRDGPGSDRYETCQPKLT